MKDYRKEIWIAAYSAAIQSNQKPYEAASQAVKDFDNAFGRITIGTFTHHESDFENDEGGIVTYIDPSSSRPMTPEELKELRHMRLGIPYNKPKAK